MKRSALFLTAAAAGLICGSLFRWGAASVGHSSGSTARRAVSLLPELGKNSPLSQEDPQAVREWESRLARHLDGPVPAFSTGAADSPRAQADTVLRLLREPVSETSMKEAVALFNASGTARYANVMVAVFERWAREAPDAALAAARGLRVPMAKGSLVWKVFEVSAGEPEIMAKAMAQPEGMIRSAALAALAESVPAGCESEALQAFIKDRRPGDWRVGGSFPYALFLKLCQEDPLHARPADPGAPLRLALETEDPAWRAFLLKTAAIHGETGSMLNLEELIRDPRNVEGLMEAIGAKLHREPEEGKKLLAALPEDKRQELLVQQAGFAFWGLTDQRHMEQVDTEGLKIFLQDLEQSEGGEAFRGLLAESALTRGAQGLAEAARWLAPRQNPAELEDLTRRAAAAEPFTTARWLAAMPPSADRDRAVAVFAETHAAVDPERAAAWAESIADPVKREAALKVMRKP